MKTDGCFAGWLPWTAQQKSGQVSLCRCWNNWELAAAYATANKVELKEKRLSWLKTGGCYAGWLLWTAQQKSGQPVCCRHAHGLVIGSGCPAANKVELKEKRLSWLKCRASDWGSKRRGQQNKKAVNLTAAAATKKPGDRWSPLLLK